MAEPIPALNLFSPSFVSDLADQMIARLDVKACGRVIEIVEQAADEFTRTNRQDAKKYKSIADDLRNAIEDYKPGLQIYEGPEHFIDSKIKLSRQQKKRLRQTLNQSCRRTDWRVVGAKAWGTLFGGLLAWARAEKQQNLIRLTKLEPESGEIAGERPPQGTSAHQRKLEGRQQETEKKKEISESKEQDRALDGIIRELEQWEDFRYALNQRLAAGFKGHLCFAIEIWRKMPWPLPFGLVLFAERNERDSPDEKLSQEMAAWLTDLVGGEEDGPRGEVLKRLEEAWKRISVEPAPPLEKLAAFQQKKPTREEARELASLARELRFAGLEDIYNDPVHTACRRKAIGLAFSGGGIRSATFNLGVLQALAKLNILPCLDYLSTVSGGGYIGSWLLAWLRRAKFDDVVKELNPDWDEHAGCKPAPQIEFLRDYSNYLTPRLGGLSADTWAAIATFFRNLLLNLAVFISLFLAVLLVPHLVVAHGYLGVASQPPSPLLSLSSTRVLWPLVVFAGLSLWYLLKNRGQISRALLKLVIFASLVGVTLLLVYLLLKLSFGGPGAILSFRGFAANQAESYFAADSLLVLCPGLILAVLASWYLCQNLSRIWDAAGPGPASQGQILAAIVVPLYGAIWILVTWVSTSADLWSPQKLNDVRWILIIVAGVDLIVSNLQKRLPWKGMGRGVLYFGIGFHWLISLTGSWWALGEAFNYWTKGGGLYFKAIAFGVPLCGIITALAGALQVGLAGLLLRNQLREWTDRLAGWILIFALSWTALFGIAFYSPLLLMWAGVWISGALSVGWLAHTISGVVSGFSGKTGKSQSGNWLDILAKTAPPVFAIGLFALLSLGIYKLLPDHISAQKKPNAVAMHVAWSTEANSGSASLSATGEAAETFGELAGRYWTSMDDTAHERWTLPFGISIPWRVGLLGAAFLLASLGVLLSRRVDVNDFSMHLFYRNRLVRCYLGASRPPQTGADKKCKRDPNLFTGFDPRDDILLADWRLGASAKPCEKQYAGPYPILNATLNLTGGQELAWQERKAESFTFTPLYCGGTQGEHEAYRPTEHYTYPDGGPCLGSAMAICGAAVSPYVGFTLSPAAGFLMTVFNARLSQWLANPSQKKWNQPGPPSGLIYLVKELFGMMDDQSDYVCVSDGGHFENLGIYELVRRRCPYIIACDAGADPELKFEDLGNAMRKCRTDFGVDINIDVSQIRRSPDTNRSPWHCVVGKIQYPGYHGHSTRFEGTLVYLKASLTGDEPADVSEYATLHSEFPHDTTANQWFGESEFESYRKLGYHVATKALGGVLRCAPGPCVDRKKFFDALAETWYPPCPTIGKHFVSLADAYDKIVERIRLNNNLSCLDKTFFDQVHKPDDAEAQAWLVGLLRNAKPANDKERRSVFYFCDSLIQLMENVYLDLDLEANYDHPDNQGWIAVFRQWAASDVFKDAWKMSGAYYGARFRRFSECVLHLPPIEPSEL